MRREMQQQQMQEQNKADNNEVIQTLYKKKSLTKSYNNQIIFQKILNFVSVPLALQVVASEESKILALMAISFMAAVFHFCQNFLLKAVKINV